MDNIRFGRFGRTASDTIDRAIARVLCGIVSQGADRSFFMPSTSRNFHRMTIARGSHAASSFECAAESELRLVACTSGDLAWTQIPDGTDFIVGFIKQVKSVPCEVKRVAIDGDLAFVRCWARRTCASI